MGSRTPGSGEPTEEKGNDVEQLAKALREEMERRNHSLRQAADIMGVAYNTVRNWSNGWISIAPRVENFQALADYLGRPLYYVLGLVGLLNDEQVELLATIPGTIQIADQMALAWVGYLNPDDAPALATAV